MENEGGVIKTLWYWQGDRHSNQKKQIGNLETDPQKYIELLFEEGAKTVVLEQRLLQAKNKPSHKPHILYKNELKLSRGLENKM